MKNLTIRNVPPELGKALEGEKRRRAASLNQTVISLLAQGLGVLPHAERRNGLRKLAGTWNREEHAKFEEAVAAFERTDEELWR